jgi:photosystem II stability/assembly factor-like uncharacterized protein
MSNRLQDDKILSLVREALPDVDDDTLSSTGSQARSVLDRVLTRVEQAPIEEATENTDVERVEAISIGSRAQHRGHRRSLVSAAVGVAALLIVGTLALQSPGHSGQRGSTAATTGRAALNGPVASPKWRLVGDITPSWRTVSGTGYEPGMFLACPTTTTCYADDLQQSVPGTYSEIEVTHDGGNTWEPSNLPVTLSVATPLACVDADTCATLGVAVSGSATFLETSDGGATWATFAGPSQLASIGGPGGGPADATILACTTAESCVAVAWDPSGAAAFVTNDGGATWTDSSLPTDFVPSGLQCVTAEQCVASGFTQSPDGSSTTVPGAMLYSSDDGATWAAASVPPGIGPLGRVSCADPTDCVASFFGDDGSSSEIIASTDGGQSWTEAAASGLPAALITGLSCSTAGACWAAGMVRAGSGGSVVLVPPERVPDGSGGPIDVTLGPGAAGIVESSSDSGQTWHSQQLPQGVLMVMDISCPSDTSCYALAIQTASPGSPASFVLLANGS